jgi:hypothetical protein
MKIEKRIAESAYCYTNIIFDSLEEYEKEYRNAVKIYQGFANITEAANKIGTVVKPINK